MSCFTFNYHGNETILSPEAGLQLTLFKNSSERRLNSYGTDTFRVAIHQPKMKPHVIRDGVYFETGRETIIRVESSKMVRESYTNNLCNSSRNYSRDLCLYNCFFDKCLRQYNTCKIFCPHRDFSQYSVLTGPTANL